MGKGEGRDLLEPDTDRYLKAVFFFHEGTSQSSFAFPCKSSDSCMGKPLQHRTEKNSRTIVSDRKKRQEQLSPEQTRQVLTNERFRF